MATAECQKVNEPVHGIVKLSAIWEVASHSN